MMEQSRRKRTNELNDFADDVEATDIEMKGVAFTGLAALMIVLGLIGAAVFAIW